MSGNGIVAVDSEELDPGLSEVVAFTGKVNDLDPGFALVELFLVVDGTADRFMCDLRGDESGQQQFRQIQHGDFVRIQVLRSEPESDAKE